MLKKPTYEELEKRIKALEKAEFEHKQAEKKIKMNGDRFRSIFEKHSAVMLLIEPDSGKILDSNKSANDFYGYTHQELTSMNIEDINILEPEKVKNDRELAETDKVNIFVFKHRLKNNTLRDVQVHSTPIEYMNQTLLFSIIHDITERKQVEAEIKATKDFYENIIEGVQDGIWVTDKNDVIFYANKSMGKIAGIPAHEIIGNNVLKDFPEETTRKFNEFYKKAKKELIPTWYETKVKTPAGNDTFQNGWLIPRIKDEEYDGIICTIRDVTKRKLSEKAMLESGKKHRTIIETSISGFWITGKHGELLDVNDAYCQMSGYSNAELLTMKISDVEAIDSQTDIKNRISIITKSGSDRFETKHRRKDGSVYDVEINIQYQPFDGGQFVCFINDITDRKQKEELINDSESRFRELVNTINSGVAIYEVINDGKSGSDYIIKDFNEYALSHENILKEDVIGKSLKDIRPTIDDFGLIDVFRKVWKSGKAELFPAKVYIDDNFTNYYENRVFKLPSGEIVAIYDDVTEKKAAEIELKTSRDLLSSVLENIPIRVFWKDTDLRFLGCNTLFALDAGMSHPEDLIGKDDFQMGWSEQAETYRADDKFVIDSKKPQLGSEEPQTTLDGHTKWLNISKVPLHDAEGKVIALLGIYDDITERKQAEKELIKAKEQAEKNELELKRAQELAHIGSWYMDIATNQVTWTEELYKMYGFDPTLPVPPYTEHIKLFTPESWNLLSSSLENTKNTGIAYELVLRTIKKDGKNGWMWVRGEAIQNNEGKTTALWGAAQDITESKQAEKEHEKLQNQLQQSQKMESVGRLAGGVAHDYNNISSIIIGYSELALENIEQSDPLYDNLMQILKAANRSTDITRQLLAFARKQTVVPIVLDLKDSIGSMLKMLRRLIGEDIDLTWLPGVDVWPIKMDPSQIDQILANLCINARDAIANVGKITIETKNVIFEEDYCCGQAEVIPGEYVLLTVSDNGSGMTPEIQDKIFEPFFTTKSTGKGTGLGLSTVYGIVKQNNGFINVYSEIDKGTTIRIYLPRYEGPIVKEHNEKTKETPLSRGEKVLLVEDDDSILKLSKRILENLGYAVLSTTSPIEAVRLAAEYAGEINLLITDVIMPEMNGRELSEKLQNLYPNLKTLFMSGYTADIIAHRGVLEEDFSFIAKPFSIKDLAVKVREVLDYSRVE